MPWWFAAQPVDETFFDSAPLRLSETFEIPLPAAQVWAELTDEAPLSWCKLLRSVTWTSPRPFGVGTTRTVRAIANASVLNEYFFRWEEGRRQSFYLLEANLPTFRRLAEDYLVEPTSATTCRFTWTIAVESHPRARLADPAN
ncbi:MAG: SRPBCC family protein, partial [Solirubrobacteraceae bacterium]